MDTQSAALSREWPLFEARRLSEEMQYLVRRFLKILPCDLFSQHLIFRKVLSLVPNDNFFLSLSASKVIFCELFKNILEENN